MSKLPTQVESSDKANPSQFTGYALCCLPCAEPALPFIHGLLLGYNVGSPFKKFISTKFGTSTPVVSVTSGDLYVPASDSACYAVARSVSKVFVAAFAAVHCPLSLFAPEMRTGTWTSLFSVRTS